MLGQFRREPSRSMPRPGPHWRTSAGQRAASERLIGTYRTVLEHLDPDSPEADQGPSARWPW
ncbi:hypothetical protein ACFQYP_19795 [Nonomuraea antimicrobica]